MVSLVIDPGYFLVAYTLGYQKLRTERSYRPWLFPGCVYLPEGTKVQNYGYRPWLFPGCVYPNIIDLPSLRVIDPGCFWVAYTRKISDRIVIDPGYFRVAYTLD